MFSSTSTPAEAGINFRPDLRDYDTIFIFYISEFCKFCINFRPDLRDYDKDTDIDLISDEICINFRPDLRDYDQALQFFFSIPLRSRINFRPDLRDYDKFTLLGNPSRGRSDPYKF